MPASSWLVAAAVASANLEAAGIVQRLEAPVPAGLSFRDDHDRAVTLEAYYHQRPIVLSLVYYDCPNLCAMSLDGLVRSLSDQPLVVGREVEVVVVSIDPGETPALAAGKKRAYLRRYPHSGTENGWHFLTGRPAELQALASAVGISYRWDPQTRQFAHPAALVVLTPEGRISRYLFGIDYPPQDLRLALLEASKGRIGSLSDQVLLRCYHFDPKTGRYSLAVMALLRAAGLGTLLVLGAMVWRLRRRESNQEVKR